MQNPTFNSILQSIDSYESDVILIQTEITATPALAPENNGQGEFDKYLIIKKYIQSLNPDSILELHAPDKRVESKIRPNIIATWLGNNPSSTVWIMCHMDIVPPGDLNLWETDPYQVVEKDGKLYGRGTEDNQQGIVSALMAVKALQDSNVKPESNIGLVFVADEEVGSKYGIQHLLKKEKDLFKNNDIILIPDAGDEKGVMIEVAEKSILWIKIETKGKQTHGSTPEKGINAHKAAAHLVVKMGELYAKYNLEDPLYDPPISTFEPTQKDQNIENINTIPGHDATYFDCRILPDYDIEDVKRTVNEYAKEIEEEFGVQINLSYPQCEPAPPPTSADAAAVHALKKAVKEITGNNAEPVGIGGGTVAAYFRQAGIPAVCWCTLDDTLHGPNEYSRIDNTLTDAKVFAHIFMQKI